MHTETEAATNRHALAQDVRILRARGMTQEQIARELRISVRTVREWLK